MSENLFQQLGGAEKVAAIVETMYSNVLKDDTLAPLFADIDMSRLRRMQYEFLASALGGPVSYSGAELQSIHAGLGITMHHFSLFVGYLASSMEQHGANKDQVDSMLGKVAMYKDRIVGSSNVDG